MAAERPVLRALRVRPAVAEAVAVANRAASADLRALPLLRHKFKEASCAC